MTITTIFCTAETGGLSANANNGNFTNALSGAGSEGWSDNQWRHTVGNFWHTNNRGNINYMVLEFDLSVLPSGDTVSDADLQLYGQQDQSGVDFNVLVAEFGIAPPWDSGDWQTGPDLAALTDLASINTSSFNASGYNTFNSSALTTVVDGKAASQAFILWSDRTESASWPSAIGEYESVNFYSYGQSGTTQDPRIVVTHEAGGGGAQNITGSAYVDADTFGSGTVSVGVSGVTGSAHDDADSFGSGSVSTGAVTISGAAHDDADAFGAGVVSTASAPAASVDLGQWTGDSTSLLPGTTWAAPNGLFPTEVINENSAYSFDSATSTLEFISPILPDGYLVVAAYQIEDTSNGRCNPQGRLTQSSGTGNFVSGASSGYNRDNSEDRSYVRTWAFLDGPSIGDEIQFQWRRDTDAPTGGTVRSEIVVIPFWYINHGIYSSTSTACPGGTTPNQLGGWSVVSESDTAAIELATNVVTAKTLNKRYLCLGGQYWQGIGSARTQRWHGFRVDGTVDEQSKAYSYGRNASNADIGEMFTTIIETAGSSRTIDQFVFRGYQTATNPKDGADVDGNTTGSNPQHAMVILELDDAVEVFRGHSNTQHSLATAGTRVDINVAETVNFNDAASFTKSSNTAFQAQKDLRLLLGSNISGGYASPSSSRFTGYSEAVIGGAADAYSFAGDYGRGDQGTQDCWGWSANGLSAFSVLNAETIGVRAGKLTGGEASPGTTIADWSGVWGLNIDTMAPAGSGGGTTITGSAHTDADEFGSGSVAAGPVSISGSLFTDADAYGSGQVAPGAVLISGSLHLDADTFGAGALSVGPAGITGAAYDDTDAFGQGTVSQGSAPAQNLGGTAYADPDEFGAGLVSIGSVAIIGTAHADPDQFGAGGVQTGGVTITGTLYVDPDSFGAGTVSTGSAPLQNVQGGAYSDPDAFGSGSVSQGAPPAQNLIGQAFLDADEIGSGSVTVGPVSLGGGHFADIDTFGAGLVAVGSVTITGASLIDLDQFGSGGVQPGPVVIAGDIFVDLDQFGSGFVLTSNSSRGRFAYPEGSANDGAITSDQKASGLSGDQGGGALASLSSGGQVLNPKNSGNLI
ncbi:MAG: hypothetical protein AAFX90_10030 [Pseudomonadota bacterium]